MPGLSTNILRRNAAASLAGLSAPADLRASAFYAAAADRIVTLCGATLLLLLTFVLGSYAVFETDPTNCPARHAVEDAMRAASALSVLFALALVAAFLAAMVPAATARTILRGWMVTVQAGLLLAGIILTTFGVIVGYVVIHNIATRDLAKFAVGFEQACPARKASAG